MMSFIHGWLLTMLMSLGCTEAQHDGHVRWRFSSEQSGNEWRLMFTATIDRGWHLYSQLLEPGGPMPTEFIFERVDGYRLLGKVIETGDVKRSYDSTFVMDVAWYESQVVFTQRVKVRSKVEVKGEIKYSVCSKDVCVPGSTKFKFVVDR